MNNNSLGPLSIFALGFRVFFLGAGLAGLALMFVWGRMYSGHVSVANYYGFVAWHAHEMIFGYTVAVIAGFLLTAVRNWTGIETAKGGRLAGLALVWLYARIIPFYGEILPGWLIAAVDLAFLPWLAVEITGAIVRGKHLKSLLIVGLLLVMTFGNLLTHLEILGVIDTGFVLGTKLAVAAVMLLILVIAGRVLPFFTERGLPGSVPRRRLLLDKFSIGAAAAFFVADAFEAAPAVAAALALAAAALNGYRLMGWYDRAIWRVPLLWVLFLGYGWIVVGFVLSALAAYGEIPPYLPLHAFTVGGIGVLTLGMMARVSLGHTGRPLLCSNAISAAFVLINLAAFARVIYPTLLPAGYSLAVSVSAGLWLIAFGLFVFVYAPILTTPRVDGRPG
ncbi:MAG: NnrS family protein [Pseudomonadota bacterium]